MRLVPRPWSNPQRNTLIALLAALILYLSIRLYLNPTYVSDPQPPDPSRASEVEDRIDPNTADAQTLAALPYIAQKRAEDIIGYREKFVADHPGRIAFTKPADLTNIRGIGNAMVAQLEPFLIFPSQALPTSRP